MAKDSSNLPQVPVAIAGAKPETIAKMAFESALGPGIAIKRGTPHFSFWNPNPTSMRGQTIESLRPDDGVECTLYPQAGLTVLRRAEGKEGDIVFMPIDGWKFLIAQGQK